MTETISPFWTVKVTLSTAHTPPKYLDTATAESSGAALICRCNCADWKSILFGPVGDMHNPQGCQDDTAWNKAQPKFRIYGSRSLRPNGSGSLPGFRAVDHCVEGVCSNEAHVFGDALALKALALLANGLPASRRSRRTSPRGLIAN